METKYIIVLIITIVFSLLIYVISSLFASSCPDGQELLDTKCVKKCDQFSEVRDTFTRQCRTKCASDEVYSNNTKSCKACSAGTKWFDNPDNITGSCQSYCETNYDCPDNFKCYENSCHKDLCSNKDGKIETCDTECNTVTLDGSTTDNICCPKEKIYSENNVAKCCLGTSFYDPDTKSCVIKCGTNICEQDEDCVKITNLQTDTINKFSSSSNISIDSSKNSF